MPRYWSVRAERWRISADAFFQAHILRYSGFKDALPKYFCRSAATSSHVGVLVEIHEKACDLEVWTIEPVTYQLD